MVSTKDNFAVSSKTTETPILLDILCLNSGWHCMVHNSQTPFTANPIQPAVLNVDFINISSG